MSEEKINSHIKLKIYLKKLLHINFFTRFIGRILLQRSYKTFRLLRELSGLTGIRFYLTLGQ